MKTERLYYDDPRLMEFDARILETLPLGARFGVILDRTAFYPTSGGQPNDLGALNGIPLLDCYEDEIRGVVVHVVPEELQGSQVHGTIDSVRRSDHMQQHSGQHVLSQAFVALFGWPTVSFHLGAVTCTIDLPAESVNREQARKAEDLANRIVQENRDVAIRYLSQENLADAGLRKPSQRDGEIRVIDIAGYDRSACGGTHVRATGEVGPILITGLERAKRQTRVGFICGNRVIGYARDANQTLESISQTVSAPPFDTPGAVRMIWDDLQRSRKRIEDLESKILDHEAAEFPVHEGVAAAVFRNRGIDQVKQLALKICERPSTVALFVDESDQMRVVFARSTDCNVDVAALLKKTVERFGGRGGGRPNLAQAGGLTTQNPTEVLEFARSLVL